LTHAAPRVAILALLAINTAIFVASGSLSEALDSIAWLTLLVLFELETGRTWRLSGARATSAARGFRLVAAVALIVAMMGYAQDGEWLDAVNVALWCAVVGLLELEVRRPLVFARHRSGFAAAAALLYAGLVVIVGAWLWRGEWFDAYDAALWLVAFALLEMDVLGIMRQETPG
jgi:hypothetical protein